MAASSATSSLILPSFSSSFSKTLIPFRPKTLILICSLSSSSSVSLSLATPLTPSPLLRKARSFRSAFVRNVAVSSDVEQEEEEEEEEEEEQQQQQASFSPDLKLFVGNLPFSVDSADLAGLFERAGNVEMVEVIYDKLTGKSRGFGFVTMSTVEEVEAAAQQFNGYELDGRALRVNSGPPPPRDDPPSRGFRSDGSFDSGRGFRSGDSFDSGRGSRSGDSFDYGRGFRSGGSFDSGRGSRSGGSFDSGRGGSRSGGSFDSGRGGSRSGGSFDSANRVYVGNLSWGVEDSDLESMFSKKGKVVEAKVVYDRDSGRSRGFGFVTFRSAEEVESAISSLNGADLDGRPIRVTAAESRPRRQF